MVLVEGYMIKLIKLYHAIYNYIIFINSLSGYDFWNKILASSISLDLSKYFVYPVEADLCIGHGLLHVGIKVTDPRIG